MIKSALQKDEYLFVHVTDVEPETVYDCLHLIGCDTSIEQESEALKYAKKNKMIKIVISEEQGAEDGKPLFAHIGQYVVSNPRGRISVLSENLFDFMFVERDGATAYTGEGNAIDDFQRHALGTETELPIDPRVYHALGLAGEAGEVADKVKKVLRDKKADFDVQDRHAIMMEIGDVLWYAAVLSHHLGYKLSHVAASNIDKVSCRMASGKIHGSGDER